jgi:hypothetical protein
MKTKPFLVLLGLLFIAGCSTTRTPLDQLHAKVLKADNDWAEYARERKPKDYDVAIIAIERKMFNKLWHSDVPDWRKRRAGWNYIIAVNEARIPTVPQPPGRGSVQPNPFY